MGIGLNLKMALRDREMTASELSRKSGVSTNTLYAIINRDSQKVRTDILEKICKNTDISLYELLDYDVLPLYEYIAPESEEEKMQAKKQLEKALSEMEPKLANFILETLQADEMFQGISESYKKLNHHGKQEAHKRVQELTKLPEYTEPEE